MFSAMMKNRNWNADPEPGIPLGSVSTTVKTDDPLPDPKQERGHELYQELMDGTAECPICHSEIGAESQMWSCSSCHHIYHFPCIKAWATRGGLLGWQCPTCKTHYAKLASELVPSCWCGRQNHANLTLTGNTCGALCDKVTRCTFNPGLPCKSNCKKPCHPGPCEPATCTDLCPSQRELPFGRTRGTANMSPVQYYLQQQRREREEQESRAQQPPSRPERARTREPSRLNRRDRRRGPSRNTRRTRSQTFGYHNLSDEEKISSYQGVSTFLIVLMAIFQAPLLYWMISRIHRWTRPLKHTHFTEHKRRPEGILAEIVVGTCVGSIFIICSLLTISFSLEGLVLSLRHRTKSYAKAVIFVFLVIIGTITMLDIPIMSCAAVGFVWNNQMKNSCKGFDTRVKMDHRPNDNNRPIPRSKLLLYTPDIPHQPTGPPGIDEFEITTPTDQSKQPTDPFYTYHRMAGALSLAPTTNLTIDFDLQNRLWRIMNVTTINTNTDLNANPTSLRYISGTLETLYKNGTWSETTRASPHMILPDLGLQIPNFFFFTIHCAYQPFMKVFNTHNLTSEEVGKEWNSENEKEVVMRTAAFGKSPDNLQVCARRGDYEVDGVKMRGLGEDIVVPLGLMAALRSKMHDDGKLKDGCPYIYAPI